MHAALQDMRYLGQVRYVHWQESKIAVPEAGVGEWALLISVRLPWCSAPVQGRVAEP